MRPSTLLYDWDNTLVDGWAGIAAALNAVFDAFAMPHWSVADTRARVRVSLRDSFPVMFGADWERARDIFYATLEAQPPAPCRADAWCGRGADGGRGLAAGRRVQQGGQIPARRGDASRLGGPFRRGGRRRRCVRRQAGSRRRSCWRSIAWAGRPIARSGISATPRSTWRRRAPRGSPPCWSATPRTMVGLTGRVPISISLPRPDLAARLRVLTCEGVPD